MADDGCSWVNVQCQVGNAIGGAVDDAIENLAAKIVDAMGKAIASLSTFWVNVDTPSLTAGVGSSTPSSTVGFIQGSLSWYVAAAAVMAVLVGGARMAWERRADPGRDLLKAMLTLVLVSGASLTGIGLAMTAADGFSTWIIGRSTTDFGTGLNRMVTLGGTAGPTNGSVPAILLIVLGLGGLLASLVQIVLLVVRGGFLIVLAGILPLSASFTNTETGRAWFQKAVAWLLAFILYKPAAAIIYATAFQLVGTTTGDDQVTSALTGVTLMIMSLVALPALLKFVAPMVGAATGGGGGGGGALAGTVATGAVSARMARGSATGGGAGAAGPSGASSTGGSGPSGSGGPSGGPGSSGGSGPAGSGGGTGASGPGGGAGAAGPSGGAGAAGPSGGGGAAGGGATAGGAAAGAGVGAAVAVAQRGVSAARGAANDSSNNDEAGPRGSR